MKRRIQERQVSLSQSLQKLEKGLKQHQSDLFTTVFDLIKDFEVLVGDLYRLRARPAQADSIKSRLEDFVASFSQELISLQKTPEEIALKPKWRTRYREIWRENFSLFLFTAILFMASIFIGWHLIIYQPEFAPLIISQSLIEEILENRPWFESIQRNPLLFGFLIAWNNLKVSFYCFIAGALLGLGGLIFLGYNGVYFGAIFAFSFINGFEDSLARFVVVHGLLELTIIVAMTFAGFLFGRVFYMRPYRLFRQRMSLAAGEAACVVMGLAPWLVIAAALEVFISPWPQIPLVLKVSLGVLAAAFFWLWTFIPFKYNPKRAISI